MTGGSFRPSHGWFAWLKHARLERTMTLASSGKKGQGEAGLAGFRRVHAAGACLLTAPTRAPGPEALAPCEPQASAWPQIAALEAEEDWRRVARTASGSARAAGAAELSARGGLVVSAPSTVSEGSEGAGEAGGEGGGGGEAALQRVTVSRD